MSPPTPQEPETEALVLHFKALVKRDARGRFRAVAPDFPAVTTTGGTQEEALSALEAAIEKHLSSTAALALECVHEEPLGFTPYGAVALGDRLYVGTNLDVVLTTESGARGGWRRSHVTQQATDFLLVADGESAEDPFGGEEETTQIQALSVFAAPDADAAVYAGTNLKGLVYVLEGEEWRPAFSTSEDQVHALAAFGGALYAGTSPSGRIVRWDGRHAEMVHQAGQIGITALAEFNGALFAGTYPDGLILRSEDGELWEIVCRSRSKLVNRLCPGPGFLYAGCSHPAGGAIFRTADGAEWERCFFSEKDVNVYALENFGGRIFAGTGEAGRLYVSRDGAVWELVLQSTEAALRVVAAHRGRLYLGCERRGVVLRTTGTEAPEPVLRDATASSVSSSRAILEWSTDVPCSALVQYGAGSVRDMTASNPTFSLKHRVVLEGLRAGTKYSYMITARNAEGNETVHLVEDGFSTPVMPAPVVTSSSHPEEARWQASREFDAAWEFLPGAAKYLVKFSPQRITGLTGADLAVNECAFHASAEGDGVFWFAVAGVDEAGNVGDVAVRPVQVDTGAAVPRAASPSHQDPEQWYGSAVVEVEAEGADLHSGPGGFLFAIGRVGEAWEHLAFQPVLTVEPGPEAHAKWALPRLPDGTWEVYVRLRDLAGNESAPVALRVQIDTAPPMVSLEALPAVSKAGELELRWAARDDRSGIGRVSVQQRRGGGATAPAWETIYEGKASSVKVEGRDGDQMWYRVLAEDRAGNAAAAETHHPVLFDGSPPAPVTALEVNSLTGGDILLRWAPVTDQYSEIARFHVHRSSEEGRLGLRIGSVGPSVLEYMDEGTGLAHGGRYLYRICAEDAVGNVQEEGVTIAAVSDKEATPPVVSSKTHPAEGWTTLTEAVLEWPAPGDDTGVREYLWRLDRNPASSLVKGVDAVLPAPPLKVSKLLDGLWYVHVATVDGAGNVSPAAHYPLRVVTRPPHARLKPLPSLVNSRKIRLEWEAEEGVVGVAIGVREGGSQTWRTLHERVEGRGREVEVEGEGVYEFSVRAYDTFGRQGVWEEGQVTLVDTTPPLEVPAVDARSLAGGRIRVEWEPSWDELAGLAGYRVHRQRAGAGGGAGTGRWDLVAEIPAADEAVWVDECAGLEDGTRVLYTIWPFDAAGNVLEQGPASDAVCDRSAPLPRLVAKSHPDSAKFYSARKVEVLWDAGEDPSGIAGLVVELNAMPGTVPSPEALAPREERTLTFDLPEDGRWYLHARTVDGAGNASETVHLSIQVDTRVDPPTASFAQDPFLEWQSGGSVTVLLKPPEDSSGVPAFWWVLDQMPATAPDRLNATRHLSTSLKLNPKAEGVWYAHVSAEDGAGNVSAPAHLAMRLTTGLPMPHITRASHPEGLWSQKRDVELAWDAVEGAGIGYVWWLAGKREEEPPPGAMRIDQARLKLNVEEGIRYLHVAAADDLGRRSAPVAYQLRVDATPPGLSLRCSSHPKGRWSSKRRVQYAIECADAHSGIARIELALTPSGVRPEVWELALGTDGEREVPGEGAWTMWARAVDLAGNSSPLAGWEIMVDLEAAPPGVFSPSHPDGIWANSTEAEVYLLPGEDLSGIAEYALAIFQAGEEVPAEPPPDAMKTAEDWYRFTLPGHGRWTLVGWARDIAGNLSLPSRTSLLVDTVTHPPVGFVVEPPAEGGWIRSRDVQVFWKAPEEISGDPQGYVWALDGSPSTEPALAGGSIAALPELDLGDLADGVHWLHVRTLDMAGNLSEETAHIKLAVDAVAPKLALTCAEAGTGKWVRGRKVEIKASGEDSVSGFTGCLWTLHAEGEEAPDILHGRWKEEPEWSVEVPRDGVWIVTVAAMDGAGNVSDPVRLTVRLDAAASAPLNVRSTSHPEAGRWYPGRQLEVVWEAPEDASGVKGFRWALGRGGDQLGDPAGWKIVTKTTLAAVLPEDGKWTVGIMTEDAVGNLSAPVTIEVLADTGVAPPKLVSTTHPNPEVWYADPQAAIAVEAADDASGIAEILVGPSRTAQPDTAGLRPVRGGTLTLTFERGAWWVHAVAVDRAGNRSDPAVLQIRVDPSITPPLVTCETHPDSEKWYDNTGCRFSISPAGQTSPREFLWAFDQEPGTQPGPASAKRMQAGPLEISADGSGEWWLHVVAVSASGVQATEATHLKVRIDVLAPEAPVMRSKTHPLAPRRSKARDLELEWDEPKDVSGIASYAYTLTRPGLLGAKTAKSGVVHQDRLKLPGLEPGAWELTLTATDRAGHTGPPGRYAIAISDVQDLYVVVRSESWRVARENVEIEVREPGKAARKLKTGHGGEAWFRELALSRYLVAVALPKPNPPIEFDGIDLEDGESYMRLEVTMAGMAWMVCRDEIRLWVPRMWLDGGRVEVVDDRNTTRGVHLLRDLPRRGAYLACAIPHDLLRGGFQLLGGPLAKLQWPVLTFARLP